MSESIKQKGKIRIMDDSIASVGGKITSSEIREIVYGIFAIDVDRLSVLHKESAEPRTAIDAYIDKHDIQTGTQIRAMLNEIFGMNLEGIAALEQARISLYSKGQWVVRNDGDLFMLHTGADDVDVKVLPTPYFTGQTGLTELPEDLQHSLSALGYRYNEKMQAYYYADPLGKPVPDAFKGQTVGAIIEAINTAYSSI